MPGTSDQDRPLRAAVVGARIGRKHAAGYAASERAELVAICDAIESRCHELADQHDVDARYTDFETMLREQRPDLLSIATPQASHAPLTILAASRYAPTAILCEKAMAGNLGEARAMVATCDKYGVKLAIGHQGRWLSRLRAGARRGGGRRHRHARLRPRGLHRRRHHQSPHPRLGPHALHAGAARG